MIGIFYTSRESDRSMSGGKIQMFTEEGPRLGQNI